jgi:hypothetical protein
MRYHPVAGVVIAISLIAAPGLSGPAKADSPFVENWRDRAIDGTFSSAKSSRSLQSCIVSGLGGASGPNAAHSEDLNPRITQIDAASMQFGVRIVDQGSQRVLIFLTDPRMTERGVAVLKSCV